MPIRVASRLYRNRHGTFYFRLIIPKALRVVAARGEIRFSLNTEVRQAAIIQALQLIADLAGRLPTAYGRHQRYCPPDYFKLWREELVKGTGIRAKVKLLAGLKMCTEATVKLKA